MTGFSPKDHHPENDPVAHIKPLQGEVIQEVLDQVFTEIMRQDRLARAGKFGGTHVLPGGPSDARFRVLAEEVGEVARELNEIDQGNSTTGKLYEELVQSAACAVSFASAIIEERDGYRANLDTP